MVKKLSGVVAAVPGLAQLTTYSRSSLRRDLPAGVTLWAMLIPQSLGFAVLAGVPPVVGLYSALGAMACYWLWGSSPWLSVGAESTVAIMVATILSGRVEEGSEEYLAQATVLALLVGVVLVVGGLLRLGRIADFLSRPVLAGYVFGSGVLIVVSQLMDFTGVEPDDAPTATDFGSVLKNLDLLDGTSLMFGLATVAVVVGCSKFAPRVPGALVAVVLSMMVVAWFDVDVAVVGEFEAGVPAFGLPGLGIATVIDLVGPAIAIALLVYPDSVLTARSLAQRDGQRVDANREFIGVGAANVGAGLLGGFPVNGSQSRSFVLADAGARTQVANLVAVVCVILTLLFLAPVFDFLPSATLAGVVIVAGVRLLDLAEFRFLWRFRRVEFVVAVVTIVAVLVLGMLTGIVVAIGLSLLAVVLRAASPHTAELARVDGTDTYRDIRDHKATTRTDGLALYRFDAPIFFANAGTLRDDVLTLVRSRPVETVVIDMEAVTDIDSSGVQVLGELLDKLDALGIGLQLARVRSELLDELQVADIARRLASPGIHLEVDDAVRQHEVGRNTDTDGLRRPPDPGEASTHRE